MASLVPCSHCLRHVRRTETQCPFCGTACAPPATSHREAPRLREAKRATLFALGLTLAGQACGGKEDTGNDRPDVGLVPPYGIGPGELNEGSGGTGGSGNGGPSGSGGQGAPVPTVPPYGGIYIPPAEGGSSGTEELDAGSAEDAGSDDAGVDPDAAG